MQSATWNHRPVGGLQRELLEARRAQAPPQMPGGIQMRGALGGSTPSEGHARKWPRNAADPLAPPAGGQQSTQTLPVHSSCRGRRGRLCGPRHPAACRRGRRAAGRPVGAPRVLLARRPAEGGQAAAGAAPQPRDVADNRAAADAERQRQRALARRRRRRRRLRIKGPQQRAPPLGRADPVLKI
ncbi:MAG: hypothetical protein J3K34DRAFT_438856 [Monoraphidium minutum]|nr:MAG: hypothetical protein J3K34DRAFT_438856 [Monoraphidium minutum]